MRGSNFETEYPIETLPFLSVLSALPARRMWRRFFEQFIIDTDRDERDSAKGFTQSIRGSFLD